MAKVTLRSQEWGQVAGWFRSQGQHQELTERVERERQGKTPDDPLTIDVGEREIDDVRDVSQGVGIA